MLLTFLNTLATIISVISLLIVTYGVFVGFIAFLRNEIKRFNGTYSLNNIRELRTDFGSYLLLGLEFLIASDILKTVVDPTLDELAILGGVVIVRTILSVFLNKEIKELDQNERSKKTKANLLPIKNPYSLSTTGIFHFISLILLTIRSLYKRSI